ncbi:MULTISPECIES: hypothetical protein [Arthrobacter]|uniref:hypothetical protein n=1 Tax=unclassified Arthrobacter TaxID=235627 RepID=UPI0024BA6771|nr:hypothetical protein [Arthrobacter sp. H35-MC1]MDJ0316144.1 hypothetical protein [Arthrobacter sp. H35-MC1]
MKTGVEEVTVTMTAAGVPAAVHRDGRVWLVGAEPVRWYERVEWWKHAQRMPKGQGRVDVQVWRLQARLGRNLRSELVTMELERDADGAPWRVRGPLQMAS